MGQFEEIVDLFRWGIAMVTKVRSHISDPVYVGLSVLIEKPRRIELRIGAARRGESRYAMLAPREAQQVAIALLTHGEESLTKAE